MAKKISAIVIPAVIDTTGIDKGINSIKTKLSGVRGSIGTRNSGTGGVGGGGNFGSGLPHYGGSALATGAAAALGAGAGRGGAKAFKSAFRAHLETGGFAEEMRKEIENRRASMSNRVSDKIWALGGKMNKTSANWRDRIDDLGVPPGTEEFANRTRNMKLMKAGGSAMRKLGGATGRLYEAADFGGDSRGKIGIAGASIGFAGAIATANEMRKNFTQGGIKANFSDLSNLESNPALYERAAAIKRRTYGPTGMPTFAQSMVLGAEEFKGKAGGGNAENLASKTDTLLAKAGNLLGQSLESNAGIILGAYEGFRNSPWGGGIKMVERLAKIFN